LNELTHLDLFSGIGGFSVGFEAANFRTIGFSEIDTADAGCVLEHFWPDVPNLGDIRKLTGERIVGEVGFPVVVTGGVPCQPASALGQMRGTADERWLWPEYIRVLREIRNALPGGQPFCAVAENPPAILTLEDGLAWNGIVSELVASGFDLQWDVFPAAAVGAGHLRERLIVIIADAQGVGKRIPSDQVNTLANGWTTRLESGRDGNIEAAAHADLSRLQGHAGHGAHRNGRTGTRRPVAPPDLRGRVTGADWWHEVNTGIPVLADGLPTRLVEAATRCTGNSIVPQVAQIIAEAIRTQLT
jgi:site-specific DNA-cytosine methylase